MATFTEDVLVGNTRQGLRKPMVSNYTHVMAHTEEIHARLPGTNRCSLPGKEATSQPTCSPPSSGLIPTAENPRLHVVLLLPSYNPIK